MTTPTPEEKAMWPPPNFKDPESRGGIVLGLTAPTLALVVIFTGVRFYGKGILKKAPQLDDWMMLIATVTSIPVSIMAMKSLDFGLGLHIWDQKPEWSKPYNKMGFAADILFPISCSVTKISLLFTYLRLFPSRSDIIFCYTLSVFVTLYTLVCILLMLFQCKPIRGYWDSSVEFTCIDMRSTLITIAALNSLSDFLVFLWPAKPLWSLRLPLMQRLGLVTLFSVGSLVCVAGICRMYYLEVYFENYDLLWNACVVWAIMAVEMNLGIICGCLSGVKPVLAVMFPRFFSSSYRSNSRPTLKRFGKNTCPESFQFEPLSGVTISSKTKEIKLEHEISIESINPDVREQRNFAWASSSGDDADPELPHNAIAVNSQVVVEREEGSVPMGKASEGDAGSEEWIMDEMPAPARPR